MRTVTQPSTAMEREGAVDPPVIDGSFALIAVDGVTVRMARSLDRPMRYFLAKRHEGPALLVSDRIDTLQRALDAAGLGQQFHPSYTRMVPAHHVVEIALVGVKKRVYRGSGSGQPTSAISTT